MNWVLPRLFADKTAIKHGNVAIFASQPHSIQHPEEYNAFIRYHVFATNCSETQHVSDTNGDTSQQLVYNSGEGSGRGRFRIRF